MALVAQTCGTNAVGLVCALWCAPLAFGVRRWREQEQPPVVQDRFTAKRRRWSCAGGLRRQRPGCR